MVSATDVKFRGTNVRSEQVRDERCGHRFEGLLQQSREVHRVDCRLTRTRLHAICALTVIVLGCGHAPEVPADGGVQGIRRLTLAYVQYAAKNRGVGPADQVALVKFVMQRDRLSKEAAEAYFVSPRDNKPYIVRWGERPLGSAPIGPDPPIPTILVIEATGSGGTRYVVDGQVSVKQMSDDDLAKVFPEQFASQN